MRQTCTPVAVPGCGIQPCIRAETVLYAAACMITWFGMNGNYGTAKVRVEASKECYSGKTLTETIYHPAKPVAGVHL